MQETLGPQSLEGQLCLGGEKDLRKGRRPIRVVRHRCDAHRQLVPDPGRIHRYKVQEPLDGVRVPQGIVPEIFETPGVRKTLTVECFLEKWHRPHGGCDAEEIVPLERSPKMRKTQPPSTGKPSQERIGGVGAFAACGREFPPWWT